MRSFSFCVAGFFYPVRVLHPKRRKRWDQDAAPKRKPKWERKSLQIGKMWFQSFLVFWCMVSAGIVTATSLCDTLAMVDVINFERMRNHIVGSKQRYEAAVEEAGGCESLGIGKGGGYGDTVWELKNIINANVGKGLMSNMRKGSNDISSEQPNEKVERFDDLALLGNLIDKTISSLKDQAARTQAQPLDSPVFVTQNCESALSSLAKELFIWRNFLYGYGVAITNRIDQCSRGLGDVPIFKEARGRRNPLLERAEVNRNCHNVLVAEGCHHKDDRGSTDASDVDL